jgi:EAL domain-containing protein (putative c-di-GMP-specific phosphodiesterase class I)
MSPFSTTARTNDISAAMRAARPYLERRLDSGEACRIPLEPLPFRIGRGSGSCLVLNTQQVSTDHAEIVWTDGSYFLLDLESANGTFVNGQRIQKSRLQNGDNISLAHEECRFIHPRAEVEQEVPDPSTPVATSLLPTGPIREPLLLQELLRGRDLQAIFRPIIDLAARQPIGFEALARGTQEQLSPNPADLLHLADQSGLACALSRQFRLAAAQAACVLPASTRLFFNLHPTELSAADLLESLIALHQELTAQFRVVLQVHEDAVTDIASFRRLNTNLANLGMEFAYLGFVAGQSRLMELAEVAPRFIKLDMRLTRGIDQSPPRQEITRALIHAAKELGVQVIADGVETGAEADVCAALGCTLAQGFLFGRARPAKALLRSGPATNLMNVSNLRQLVQQRDAKPGSIHSPEAVPRV